MVPASLNAIDNLPPHLLNDVSTWCGQAFSKGYIIHVNIV